MAIERRTDTASNRLLEAAIVLLAVADAALHVYLVFRFFRGNFFANELSISFLLNALGYVALIALFLLSGRLLGERRWLANLLMLLYALVSIGYWVVRGSPNPAGLGYPSKVLEALLAVAVLVHWRGLRRSGEAAATPSPQA